MCSFETHLSRISLKRTGCYYIPFFTHVIVCDVLSYFYHKETMYLHFHYHFSLLNLSCDFNTFEPQKPSKKHPKFVLKPRNLIYKCSGYSCKYHTRLFITIVHDLQNIHGNNMIH